MPKANTFTSIRLATACLLAFPGFLRSETGEHQTVQLEIRQDHLGIQISP